MYIIAIWRSSCESEAIAFPGGLVQSKVAIDYTYNSFYRLNSANYSTGDSYQYAYDSVSNRLTQESMVKGLSSTVNYNYDIANRLTDVYGAPYVYDGNGNLISDGQNT